MSDTVTKLRATRANMIGTEDEDHYWACHEAACQIESLKKENAELQGLKDEYYLEADEYLERAGEAEAKLDVVVEALGYYAHALTNAIPEEEDVNGDSQIPRLFVSKSLLDDLGKRARQALAKIQEEG